MSALCHDRTSQAMVRSIASARALMSRLGQTRTSRLALKGCMPRPAKANTRWVARDRGPETQWFGQSQAAEVLSRARSATRRERLCEIGKTPGLMRSRANRRAIVRGHVDDRQYRLMSARGQCKGSSGGGTGLAMIALLLLGVIIGRSSLCSDTATSAHTRPARTVAESSWILVSQTCVGRCRNKTCWTATPRPSCSGREERYLIVACTVITDVPEAVGP
jgi:hypothetical protein